MMVGVYIDLVVINILFFVLLCFVGGVFGYKFKSDASALQSVFMVACLLFVPVFGGGLSLATALSIISKSFKRADEASKNGE